MYIYIYTTNLLDGWASNYRYLQNPNLLSGMSHRVGPDVDSFIPTITLENPYVLKIIWYHVNVLMIMYVNDWFSLFSSWLTKLYNSC